MNATAPTAPAIEPLSVALPPGHRVAGRNRDGLLVAIDEATRILWFPTVCCTSHADLSGVRGPYCAACLVVVDEIHVTMGSAEDLVE